MSSKHKEEAILITGAAGFIGSHLSRILIRHGQPVVGIDNFSPFYSKSLKQANITELLATSQNFRIPFHFYVKDVRDLGPECLEKYAFSCVVHLAAEAGVRSSIKNPETYFLTNVLGTLKVLEFCKLNRIRSLVLGSSSSVYGNSKTLPLREDAVVDQPRSPYACTKRAAELSCYTYAHLYGLSVAACRLFTVYGPKQRPDLAIHKFAIQLASNEPITLYGEGGSRRDYTFVADIVAGLKEAVAWTMGAPRGEFQIFNLGSGKATSLVELVKYLEEGMNTKAKIIWEGEQPGDVDKTLADITKSRQWLKYHPQTGIKDGIKSFLEWFDRKEVERVNGV